MNFKNLCPEDIIKISSCLSLIITENLDAIEVAILKNILCLISSNLSAYQSQQGLCDKRKNHSKN